MRFRSSTALSLIGALMTALAAGPAPTQAPDARRAAYEAALKCFVANGSHYGHERDASNAAAASYYEEKGHASFDAAVKLGGALGYSNERVTADLQTVQIAELPKLVGDSAYSGALSRTCQAIGLM